MAKSKTMSFAVNDEIEAAIERVQGELGPVWEDVLGAPMSKSEAIRWLVQAGLKSLESLRAGHVEPGELFSSSISKKKTTVLLEPAVVEALDALQAVLEAEASALSATHALYGDVRYTHSTAIQTAILKLCKEHDVQIAWGRRVAGDLATGEVVDIPDGVEVVGDHEPGSAP